MGAAFATLLEAEPGWMADAGDMIKEARKRLLMSQKDVADELGVDQRTVSYWEKAGPPKKHLAALAKVLKLNIGDLFEAAGARVMFREDSKPPAETNATKTAAWLTAISSDAELDLLTRAVLALFPAYAEGSLQAFVTKADLLRDVPEVTEDNIEDVWESVMDSGYLKPWGTKGRVFTLVTKR